MTTITTRASKVYLTETIYIRQKFLRVLFDPDFSGYNFRRGWALMT
jgi:hypothetical protein